MNCKGPLCIEVAFQEEIFSWIRNPGFQLDVYSNANLADGCCPFAQHPFSVSVLGHGQLSLEEEKRGANSQ